MIREVLRAAERNCRPVQTRLRREEFEYCKHYDPDCQSCVETAADMQLYATLYTPPVDENHNAAGGGGEARATLKNGLELELGGMSGLPSPTCRKTACRFQYLSYRE